MYDDLEIQYVAKNPYEDIQTTVVAIVQPLEEAQLEQLTDLLEVQISVQCARLGLELLDLESQLQEKISGEKRKKIKKIK